MTLLISNRLLKNCMIDSGAVVNIMPFEVMNELGMWVDTTYGKFYAMDNRYALVVGIMKDIEFIIATFLEAS